MENSIDKKTIKKRPRKRQLAKVQQLKHGQCIITLPDKVATEWLNVIKGTQLEFKVFDGNVIIIKVRD